MGRIGITYLMVSDAANALKAVGEVPTYATIRIALGNTGSSSTIGKHLQRWHEEQQHAAQEQLSSGVDPAMLQALRNIEEQAKAKALQVIEQLKAAHAEAMAEQMDLRLAAERRAEDEATECHALGVELAGAEAELRAQAAALVAMQQRAELDAVDRAGLQQRLQDSQAEQRELHQQFAQMREQFEHYQEATAQQRADELRSHAAQLLARDHELHGLRQAMQDQLLELRDAQREREALRLREESLSGTLAATEARLTQTAAELGQRQQDCALKEALEQELRRQLAESQAQLELTHTALRDEQVQRAVLADRYQRAEQALQQPPETGLNPPPADTNVSEPTAVRGKPTRKVAPATRKPK